MPDEDGVRIDQDGSVSVRPPGDGDRWGRLHSSRDPIAEADRLLLPAFAEGEPSLLVVVGLGLGYVLDALERRGAQTKVLAVEPLPAVVGRFLQRRDWTAWTESGRLTLLAGPDYKGASNAWRLFDPPPDRAPQITSPVLAREFPAHVERAARVLEQIVYGAQSNAKARERFGPLYRANTIANRATIERESDVSALAGRFEGVPAILIAAGPSLDRNLPAIVATRDKAALIAVDTTLRSLLRAGIEPDLVVGVDPSDLNAQHLVGLPPCPNSWLVGEGSLDPRAFGSFEGRTFTFRESNHDPWPEWSGDGLDRGRLRAWGSVLTSAFDLALVMGCNPIVFTGADLAYTGMRMCCSGTHHDTLWGVEGQSPEYADAFHRHLVELSPHVSEPDLHGEPTVSTETFKAFRDWLREAAANCDRDVVHATGASILVGGGIRLGSIEQALPPARPPLSFATADALRAAWQDGRSA
jgi:hypothetical protein